METRTDKGVKVELGSKATVKAKKAWEKRQKEGQSVTVKEPKVEKEGQPVAVKEPKAKKEPVREKNKYGFVVGTRKDFYCTLLEQGKYSKTEMVHQAEIKFGHASENAFQFFLRDLKLKGYKVQRRTLLSLDSMPQ